MSLVNANIPDEYISDKRIELIPYMLDRHRSLDYYQYQHNEKHAGDSTKPRRIRDVRTDRISNSIVITDPSKIVITDFELTLPYFLHAVYDGVRIGASSHHDITSVTIGFMLKLRTGENNYRYVRKFPNTINITIAVNKIS